MKKNPFSVTILLYLVLSLTVWSALRLVASIQWWRTLQAYTATVLLLYMAVSAGIWLAAGVSLQWGLWRKKAWARKALFGAGAGFAVWYWCDRLFVQWPHNNWMFALGATLLYLIIGMIGLMHPKTKKYLQRENYD